MNNMMKLNTSPFFYQ